MYIIRTGNALSKVFTSQEEITTHLADSSPPIILSLTEASNGVITMVPIAKLVLTLALLEASQDLTLPSSPSVVTPPPPIDDVSTETHLNPDSTLEELHPTEDSSFESPPKALSVPLEKQTVRLPKTPVSTRRLGKVTTLKQGAKK
jgi:hypothetical protein